MTPVFAVGDASTAARLLPGKTILISDAYIDTSWLAWEPLTVLLAAASSRWFDCGAFTRWQQHLKGQEVTLPTVESWAERIVTVHGIFDHFIALDVINDAAASLANWTKLLELVPRELHHKLIPVWHEGDPIEHLEEYDPGSRLVALGRTGGRQAGAAGRKKTFVFYDEAFNRYPDGLYHMLGNANPETIEPYPVLFFDASTWQRDSAYAESHGFPWSRVSRDTRMRAYIEAIETITHRPRAKEKQTTIFDLAPTGQRVRFIEGAL